MLNIKVHNPLPKMGGEEDISGNTTVFTLFSSTGGNSVFLLVDLRFNQY